MYGKFKAYVKEINDPERRGRIRVLCPAVFGDSLSKWCEPNIPCAIDSVGDFFIPPISECVWIEFEEGDISKPVYTGGWYAKDKLPPGASADVRVIGFKNTQIRLRQDVIDLRIGGTMLSLTASDLVKLRTLINSL